MSETLPEHGPWSERYQRREDTWLLEGRGCHLVNLPIDDVLDGVFVRSTTAHGALRSIDLAPALEAPGVVAAFTADDLRLPDIPSRTSASANAVNPMMSRPALARDRVRYVGEQVALVVADTEARAVDAAELAEVDIDPLPVVSDARAAVLDETLLFEEAGTNVAARRVNEDTGPDDNWPVSVTVRLTHARLVPAPLEPLGIIAIPDDDGLIVWCGHQAPHRLRDQLAGMLGLEKDQVRVIVPDVGGGFGLRMGFYPEYLAVAGAALRVGRPVRWIATRYENFLCGTHGRDQYHEVTLAGDRDGRIRHFEERILADVGAYPHNGSHVPEFTFSLGAGPYDIEHVRLTMTTVVSNRAPTGVYRGAGRPEATASMERAVDEFARAAGLDAMEVRRKNFIAPGKFPYHNAGGLIYDSGNYAAALDAALACVDMPALREEQRRRADGPVYLGVGAAAFVDRAGGAVPSLVEYARAEFAGDGTLRVRAGSSSAGQGHITVWSQIAADVFECARDDVDVIIGDTTEVKRGTGSFASRSGQMAGSAIKIAAERLYQRVLNAAADELEVSAADLEIRDGMIWAKGDPAGLLSVAEVAARAARRGEELADEEVFAPNAFTLPSGVHLAVVEVDAETGRVAIRQMIAADDCGNILNPMIVEGQIHGSLAQGIGAALYEEMVYGEDGQPVTTGFIDYPIPSAADLPSYVTTRVVTPSPTNPLGVKGAGESGCLGAPAAIGNAVVDALQPLDLRDVQLPLTPYRVWQAIQRARAESAATESTAGGQEAQASAAQTSAAQATGRER
ncbi:MAG TPA: xanthine dehydrogenase family protein molybdopterin-binding subunit [Trebonia sp.]|nr:xanthine dehydrogenase family protein molybdopterin-binding subunit [Trebonia sp.]